MGMQHCQLTMHSTAMLLINRRCERKIPNETIKVLLISILFRKAANGTENGISLTWM